MTGRAGLVIALIALSATAHAVVIASGDGTGNTGAPADDPGFANVGVLNGLSGVYLGNGWVLSAWHVGQAPFVIGGVTYQPVMGSRQRPVGPGSDPPDLMLLKIDGDPGLPMLPVATAPPGIGEDVVLIGNGRSRDQPITHMGYAGWSTKTPFTMRWGTNEIVAASRIVAGLPHTGPTETQSLQTSFDAPGTTLHESQAVLGDSGGALFWKQGSDWKLLGIMWGSTIHPGQPDKSALEGNRMVAADLAHYRAQILAIVQVPGCSDGFDDDGDGLTDFPADPGCSDASDVWETDPGLVCDDALDNDGDGLVDHPDDPQCISPEYHTEAALVPAGGALIGAALSASLGAIGFRRLSRLSRRSRLSRPTRLSRLSRPARPARPPRLVGLATQSSKRTL